MRIQTRAPTPEATVTTPKFESEPQTFNRIQGVTTDPVGLAKHIVGTEGAKGLFRGNGIDMLRQIPYSAVQYLIYEKANM